MRLVAELRINEYWLSSAGTFLYSCQFLAVCDTHYLYIIILIGWNSMKPLALFLQIGTYFQQTVSNVCQRKSVCATLSVVKFCHRLLAQGLLFVSR